MPLNNLSEKISKLPPDAVDLFMDLLTDHTIVTKVLFHEVEITLSDEDIEELIYILINIEIEQDRNSINGALSQIISDTEKRSRIIQNIKDSVWFELDDIYEEDKREAMKLFEIATKLKQEKSKEDPLETAKLAEEGHISHLDILGEIENPTPSIKTTATFQNTESKTTPTEPIKSAVSAPGTNTPKTANSPDSTSLHSPAPVAPYTNPALNIATKLDQKLSTPTASIPKDVYVSKKPDPYHEPVDL